MADVDTRAAGLEMAFSYHDRTKHHPGRFARSLGFMDWDTQPNPFRRYQGANLIPLDEVPPGPDPALDTTLRGGVEPRPCDRSSISQLFYDSLALSAWKQLGSTRWPLRVNPSSGNLHPTEGYLISGPIDGVLGRPAICHYAPLEHGLEKRVELSTADWSTLAEGLPSGAVLVGLSSIYWRESWKYGERAFRYCHHDAGHAIAAVAIAAAALGWKALVLEAVTDDQVASLLGLREQTGAEAEHPDCVLAVSPSGGDACPRGWRPPAQLVERLGEADWVGTPTSLSDHHHDWPIIDEVAAATTKLAPPAESFWRRSQRGEPRHSLPARTIPVRELIRQRRSAVAMDGVTGLSLPNFRRMLATAVPSPGTVPFDTLPWAPRIHLALFVHRVADLPEGLYVMVRDASARDRLRKAMHPDFLWELPRHCPPELGLELLAAGDMRDTARSVSCGQEIAADGAFALGMIADFEEPLSQHGAWFYERLHWEAGLLGQVLYLEAEAARVRSTGIGCYFDDLVHERLGLQGRTFQSLYHFTVGGHVDDPRLRTAPPYRHRDEAGRPPDRVGQDALGSAS